MLTILKKWPFKGTYKLSLLFYIVLRGPEQVCGISDPSKQISAGYQIPLKNFRWISGPFNQNFAGYNTPQKKFS
jgi:hypothetical protein